MILNYKSIESKSCHNIVSHITKITINKNKIIKFNNNEIRFDNNSSIHFNIFKEEYSGGNYDIIYMDNINWFTYQSIINDNFIRIISNDKTKLLFSGYDPSQNMKDQIINIEKTTNKKIFTNYYKTDKTLETYLRRKKIKQLQSKIMV